MSRASRITINNRLLWLILSTLIWALLCQLTLILNKVNNRFSLLRTHNPILSSHHFSRCYVRTNNPIRPWKWDHSRDKSRILLNRRCFLDHSIGVEFLGTRESSICQQELETLPEEDNHRHSVLEVKIIKRTTWEEVEVGHHPRTCQPVILK